MITERWSANWGRRQKYSNINKNKWSARYEGDNLNTDNDGQCMKREALRNVCLGTGRKWKSIIMIVWRAVKRVQSWVFRHLIRSLVTDKMYVYPCSHYMWNGQAICAFINSSFVTAYLHFFLLYDPYIRENVHLNSYNNLRRSSASRMIASICILSSHYILEIFFRIHISHCH